MVMYEQCVRTFWHDERYKDDLRYLKVWMEYVSARIPLGVMLRSVEVSIVCLIDDPFLSPFSFFRLGIVQTPK